MNRDDFRLAQTLQMGLGKLRRVFVTSVAGAAMVAIYCIGSMFTYGLAVTGISSIALTSSATPAAAQRRRRNRGSRRRRGNNRRRGNKAARVIGSIVRAIEDSNDRRRRSRRSRRRRGGRRRR